MISHTRTILFVAALLIGCCPASPHVCVEIAGRAGRDKAGSLSNSRMPVMADKLLDIPLRIV